MIGGTKQITFSMTAEIAVGLPTPLLGRYKAKSEQETIDKVCSVVSKCTGISLEDMKSKARTEEVKEARHICVTFLYIFTTLTKTKLGQLFNRDHSTIVASINVCNDRVEMYPEYREKMYTIKKLIEEALK